jgi:NAD(P)-dependent dehydrogenase (short-subunit alcohol dehydrogenase family)
MKRLEGKVAVITGGNSGIGLAAAKRLQEEGAKIAIFGRSRKTLDEAVKTIGNGVVAVQGDVAKTHGPRQAVRRGFAQAGKN